MSSFSSRGPVTVDGSGRMKPDIVAPGYSIRSSFAGGTYVYMSGTSMAAPHVAGVVALLWSSHPELARNVNDTEAALRRGSALVAVTQACGSDVLGQGPNNVAGYGLPNASTADGLVSGILSQKRWALPLVTR